MRKCSSVPMVPMKNRLLGWEKKDSLKDKILPELLYCIQIDRSKTLLFRHGFPKRGQNEEKAYLQAAPLMSWGWEHTWRKGGKFPALEESRREYPQKSEIPWHGFNFLFLNLLKHFFKSKQNITTTKNPSFFYN